MRRNGRRGNNSAGGAGNGPLLTGHLRDIDLELQLLKRKREMIEQQHQLLAQEEYSRHAFDQMRYDEPDFNRDFTHLYEPGPRQRSQFGRKRQADNQWQYENAPKRTSAKKKSQSNQQGSGNPGSGNFRNQRPNQGSKPAALMEMKVKPSVGQKIANQKAPPNAPRKDFAPSKVAKPKASPAPNKLASYPVTERKTLVAAATEASSDGNISRMLLPDREPSVKVGGRLELALGAIMKNIKGLIEVHPQYAPTLRSIQLQRVMKQAVRERIRTVMLGKVVGSLVDILAIYREEFPAETDADVLNIALEACGITPPDQKEQIKFIESAEPNEFFKLNMNKLLETTINEMYEKLEEMYGNAPSINPEAPQKGPEEPQKSLEEPQKSLEAPQKSPEAPEKSPGAPEKNSEEPEKISEEPEKISEAPKKKSEAPKKNPEKQSKEMTELEYKAFLNTTLKVFDVKRILPRLMKKYVPYMIKLLNVDGQYQATKAAIIEKTNEKAAQLFSATAKERQGDGQTNGSMDPTSQTSKENRYNLPYYVKILGKPTLPKRKVMQGFLNQFNPKSIKKHRTIHNLLFIGFTEKSDYDTMVGADGSVIGRSTLSVRVCSTGGPQGSNGENAESNDVKQEGTIKQDRLNQSDGDTSLEIPTDLDGQITSLLSAIRSEDEEKTENDGGEENLHDVNEQAENTDQGKIEECEGDVKNDEAMDENLENKENEENNDKILDENASQEKDACNEEEAEHLEAANESEAQDTEATDETYIENSEKLESTDDSPKDENSQEGDIQMDTDKASDSTKDENSQEGDEASETAEATKTDEQAADDKVSELKSSATGRNTPSRMSARLANVTPSTIRTRRASRLTSQN